MQVEGVGNVWEEQYDMGEMAEFLMQKQKDGGNEGGGCDEGKQETKANFAGFI